MSFDVLIYLYIFCLGTIFGSFLNCVIYRLHSEESFLKGRSFCPNCQHILSWQDLIPVFSFLALKGKCRYCHKPISLQYPLVELATGLLFVFTTYNLQLTTYNLKILLNLGYQLLVVSCLVIVFVYDLKHYIIPDKVIYPAIALAFLYQLYQITQVRPMYILPMYILTGVRPVYAALGAAAFFLILVVISHEKWLGWGDVKLAFLMGLFLGWPKILLALFLAFFIGAIIGIELIILGKKTLKSEIPFGPFLVSGTFLALFFGQKILDWYLNFFLLK